MSTTTTREEALRRAAEQWKRQLVDVSGRNRLLYYRDLNKGTLDLSPGAKWTVDASVLEALLGGRGVRMSRLFPDEESHANVRQSLAAIHRRTQEHLDEKGLNTLFIAVGLATWRVGSGPRPNAPVVLVPVAVTPDGAGQWDFNLELSGDAHINPILAHVLRTEHGVEAGDEDDNWLGDLPARLDDIWQLLAGWQSERSTVPDLAVTNRLALGNFIYTNMPMVADLEHNLSAFASNDFVAAIAGVDEARQALTARIQEPAMNRPDTEPLENEFLVVDADASQNRAINRVLTGESLVIWGPPGTGKSQTIANLIAGLIGQGKRVLFVAEKRAAIEVVIARLRRVGLSNLVMDAHGGIRSKRDFAKSIADSMRDISAIPANDYSELHSRLLERRTALVDHVDDMHRLREPWQVSLFDLQAKLIGTPESAVTNAAMSSGKARALDRQAVNHLMADSREWVDLEGPEIGSRYPEWARADVDSPESAQQAFNSVRETAARLPEVRRQWFTALDEVGLAHPNTVADWAILSQLLSDIGRLQERFTSEVYGLNHTDLVSALAPADSRFEPIKAILPFGRYYRARQTVRAALRTAGNLSGRDALQAVQDAAGQTQKWHELSGDNLYPRIPEQLRDILAALDALTVSLERVGRIFSENLLAMPHTNVEQVVNRLASQQSVAAKLPRVRELESKFADAGIDGVTTRVGDEIPPEHAAEAIEHHWLRAVWDELTFGDPRLAGFTGDAHSRREQEFIGLDRQHLDITPQRIRRAAAEAATTAMNVYPSETALLRSESVKQRRHLPVRRLFNRNSARHHCYPPLLGNVSPVGRRDDPRRG